MLYKIDLVVVGFELKRAPPWSPDCLVVALPLFSRECGFGGLAWVVTTTPRAVHCHPLTSAKGSMASSNYPLGLDHWRGIALSGARHCPVWCPRIKKELWSNNSIWLVAINRSLGQPWAGC
jgi:hypothetical protein